MDLSRRAFLFLTGGSGAAWAAEPSRQMVNRLIPYVIPPDKIRPGTWGRYASTCRECPAGCGMHLWHRDGRITKAEGNPAHPINRGSLCARGQSALQGLYDPDRLRQPASRDEKDRLQPVSWDQALTRISKQMESSPGRTFILSDLQTGSLAEIMGQFAAHFGETPLLCYEPYNYQSLREAYQLLFDRPIIPAFRLGGCDFILSLACDFLETWLSPVEFAGDFAQAHGFNNGTLGRFAYVGPRLSMTAGNADDFFMVAPGRERFVALAMVQVMLERGWCRNSPPALARMVAQLGGEEALELAGLPRENIIDLAHRFSRAKASVALAGSPGPAHGRVGRETALASTLLNLAAGRIGQTVDFSRSHALQVAATHQETDAFLSQLGRDDVLIIHGSNPAFTRPSSVENLQRAGTLVHLTTLPDETSALADWILPLDAPAESWGDYAPWSGIEGLLQPTLARLYDTRSGGDIFLELAERAGQPLTRPESDKPVPRVRQWLESRWRELFSQLAETRPFPEFWEDALRGGGIWQETTSPPLDFQENAGIPSFAPQPDPPAGREIVLCLYPSIFFFDGRTANRGWLQEAPDPISTVSWGDWLDLHPETAGSLGLRQGDLATVKSAVGSIETPVRITEDVLQGVAAIPMGQGHSSPYLRLARGLGSNPFLLLGPGPAPQIVSLKNSGRQQSLVTLSASQQQHNRDLLRSMPLPKLTNSAAGKGKDLIMPLPEGYIKERDLYPPHQHKKHRWAMIIDLQRCIGCGACAVACYAENNIAVVGRDNAAQGLEMAWLKAVPYRGQDDSRRVSWLPLLCQHCDAAPCEPVCPVFAAVHNEEGLNAQIYNRCIGTRYCSNNCPYKVRRFNWINPIWESPLELQLNPEVTVRSRGVMEKCTFCVQRIRQAEYQAMRENRKLRDGEIMPACQQTCPTGVFIFGDLLDPDSSVSKMFRGDPRRYQLLKELNTKPAVVYLQKIRMENSS